MSLRPDKEADSLPRNLSSAESLITQAGCLGERPAASQVTMSTVITGGDRMSSLSDSWGRQVSQQV